MSNLHSPPRNQPAVHASMAVMDGDRLLLVQEQKTASFQLWNLPGGHVEHGESLLDAVSRELLEETTLIARPDALLGIYSNPASVLFVFRTPYTGQLFAAGDEILDVRFFELAELAQWPDTQLVGPIARRQIFADLAANKRYPLDAFVSLIGGGL